MNFKEKKEELYSRNFTKFGLDINVFVSLVTAFLVLAFIIFTILKPSMSAEFFLRINNSLNKNFNWLYIITINGAFVFLIFMGFSKFGNIRLGGYTSKPEYKNLPWYAMMFSAGIGIGMFFYGVAEPIYHFNIPVALRTGSAFDNFKMCTGDGRLCGKALFLIFVILSGTKDLHFEPFEILRYAQNNSFHTACRPWCITWCITYRI